MNFDQDFQKLTDIMEEVSHLNSISKLLSWDQSTYLPEDGFAARGKQLATIGKIIHDKFTNPYIGDLIKQLKDNSSALSSNSYISKYVAVIERSYNRATKIPASFVANFIEHQTVAYENWIKAKDTNNFKLIQPHLEKTLELSKEYSSFFSYDHIADPLISEIDYGFNTENIRQVFNELKKELVPFVKSVLDLPQSQKSFLTKSFPVTRQEEFNHLVLNKLNFDFNRGRLDKTAHPFMITLSHGDIRITTRYDEHNFTDSLFSTIHEMGHAFYEMGIAKKLEGSPLYEGTSSAVHESQSRLWENIVGRSYEFWEFFYPSLVEYFPEQLKSVSLAEFYSQINKVERSFIRTEADELTYNLHVLIRFQLEIDMLENKLKVADLPEAWNALYKENLGVTVPSNSLGCLQDVHWFAGMIGGQFQGYTLGNIMSAQFFAAAKKALPNLSQDIRQGQFLPLRAWLTDNLYQYGKMYDSQEILEKTTGEKLTIKHYMDYLKTKFPINSLA
ncbi:carboxypeptidase M32 [Pigmentibacter sp. JX0631]|uniref:carboxypeptidase M32 n=1 Tax=Pigmentibacter sp. JX0631 TaxID=2976982 RepID=UPI002468CA5E|nr:carboxypeptidase M32 [Pigmentibacter sp. JX0631]WGL60052.1 carboxypeptidase M32 [Pigmentibacter sp. JX0631]